MAPLQDRLVAPPRADGAPPAARIEKAPATSREAAAACRLHEWTPRDPKRRRSRLDRQLARSESDEPTESVRHPSIARRSATHAACETSPAALRATGSFAEHR